jgi:hypothetical protein
MSLGGSAVADTRPFGLNFIAHVSGDFGLGVAARNSLRLAESLGVPVAALDVPGGHGKRGSDTTFAHLVASGLPYGVNLFHMNPPEIERLLGHRPAWFASQGVLNACVPFWELPRVPRSWEPVLGGMDVILAPTTFVGDAVRAALPDAEIVPYPQAVAVPPSVHADRARWGLPAGAAIFLCTFGMGSGFARKNPLAAVRAFRAAFGASREVALVLRVNHQRSPNPTVAREEDAQLAKLRETASGLAAYIVDQPLTYADVLELYASCDALVSLHRSEGLGLHLMEAMALGKPVIATAWSGNTDFMTPENSCLVGYELVAVRDTPGAPPAYGPAAVGVSLQWAQPVEEEAAGWMRRLATDPALRASIGQRAASDMDAASRRFERGQAFAELRRRWEAFDPADEAHKQRERLLRKLWRLDPVAMAKDAVKGLLP